MEPSKDVIYLIIAFVFLIMALLSVAITYLMYGNKRMAIQEAEKMSLFDKLRRFEEDIEKKQQIINNFKSSNMDSEVMNTLQRKFILTNEDWIEFKKLFDGAYKEFAYNIKNNYDIVTSSEMRLLMLARLGMSYKEMATILGVSVNLPRVTCRFKKKQNLDENMSIHQFSKVV